ncbi:T9SS type A sorting domain-containing protein [Pontibacter korlensis]|uniref:T9SS type A sorting domain-containing protein n=1 Tax=Pontibacter korlensis TaxID=400092 RepID=UPI000695E3DD|nr:T9SS type A sorting domain-containing protein [Pontibacter korlensis]
MLKLYFNLFNSFRIFSILLLLSAPVFAQNTTQVFFEQFSGNSFPNGWKSISDSDTKSASGYEWQVVQGVNSREGQPQQSAMNIEKKNPSDVKNINVWAFTPAITMYPDVIYTISFYHQNKASGTASFELAINTAQDYSNATIIASEPLIDKSRWEEHEYIVTVNTEGQYYLGIGIKQLSNDIDLSIDEIRVTASSGPLEGTYNVGLDGDFVKPEIAIRHLGIRGISGEVIFNHTNPTYYIEDGKKLTIDSFTGAGNWPVTFKSATPGSATIKGSSDKESLIYLNMVDNIHFSGFKIHNSSAKTPWGIAMDKSNNCSVSGCTISAGTETGNTGARGITINSGSNIRIINNMIHSILGTGIDISSSITDSGLDNLYGVVIDEGENHKLYNNSISMTGQRSVTGSVAAALAVASGTTGLDVRNNILVNTQTASSGALRTTNYAVYSLADRAAFSNINYNLYFVASSSTSTVNSLGFIQNTNAASLADWKAATLMDGSSMFGEPAFTSNTNLAINPSSPRSWFTNGTGVQIAAVPKDMLDVNRSISVATGGVDMGALEFIPTATAPDMAVSGERAAGKRQVFYFAGREMAAVTWSPTATNIPSNFAIKYKPGQFLNSYPIEHMNSSMEILNGEQNNVATYSYDFEMYYDEALLGNLQENSLNFTLSQKDTPDSEWVSHNDIEYNFDDNKLIKSNVESAAHFVGSDYNQPMGTLPVTIKSFTAKRSGMYTIVNWETGMELNNKGFEIQTSTDGHTFTALDFVEAKSSNSAQGNKYSYTDIRNGKAGVIYYRLKQIDTDGTFELFGPKAVDFGKAGISMVASPNPFSSEIELSIEAASSDALLITVVNTTGKEVFRENVPVQKGLNKKRLQAPSYLPAGLYVLSAIWNDQTQRVKLVKE